RLHIAQRDGPEGLADMRKEAGYIGAIRRRRRHWATMQPHADQVFVGRVRGDHHVVSHCGSTCLTLTLRTTRLQLSEYARFGAELKVPECYPLAMATDAGTVVRPLSTIPRRSPPWGCRKYRSSGRSHATRPTLPSSGGNPSRCGPQGAPCDHLLARGKE